VNVNDAQRMILSSAFHNGPDVFDSVPPSDLADPWRGVALALAAIHTRREQVTIASLTTECVKRGFLPRIETWMMGPIDSAAAVRCWMEATGRERIEAAISRARLMLDADTDTDPFVIASDLIDTLGEVERPAVETEPSWWTYEEVMGFAEQPVEWVIPDLLARRDRLMLTGKEGSGKSTLLYQIALCAGFGISPVDARVRYPRQRVTILDVENSHETQVATSYRLMHRRIHRLTEDHTPPDVRLLRIRDIDLVSPTQRQVLIDAVDATQPDLLIMGSGYKLVDASEDWRVMATSLQRTADKAKARTGCAVIIETHAGHGTQGDRNGYRPDGSSLWLRWPEFGHGLGEHPDHVDILEHVRWRNDRVVGRDWPAGWERDPHGLPWRPIAPDEWEARDLTPASTGGGWNH
jgi:replicative DNA helicase